MDSKYSFTVKAKKMNIRNSVEETKAENNLFLASFKYQFAFVELGYVSVMDSYHPLLVTSTNAPSSQFYFTAFSM